MTDVKTQHDSTAPMTEITTRTWMSLKGMVQAHQNTNVTANMRAVGICHSMTCNKASHSENSTILVVVVTSESSVEEKQVFFYISKDDRCPSAFKVMNTS